MIRAGLTGGLASGKSFVAGILKELGCYVIDADALGREVLRRGGEAYEPVLAHFGAGILDASGEIDRKALSARVFGAPERLAELNALVHPAVIRREEELLDRAGQSDPHAIGIVEAAILIETGSYRRFDKLILVVCTLEQQVQRAMDRGYSREQAMARIARQMPVEEKRRYAGYIIDTSGTEGETERQTRSVYRSLRSLDR